jgi:hypothetical protein
LKSTHLTVNKSTPSVIFFSKSQETFDAFTDYKTILKLRKVWRLCGVGLCYLIILYAQSQSPKLSRLRSIHDNFMYFTTNISQSWRFNPIAKNPTNN